MHCQVEMPFRWKVPLGGKALQVEMPFRCRRNLHEEMYEEKQEEDPQDEEELNMDWDEEEGFLEPNDMNKELEVQGPEIKDIPGEEPVE
ncbi:hypothetical protein RIF29_29095 [Crotalaria pallida]|uniref:Uncharacterized protein n=1 Tax=Crotalaria pallida TaxID=3830 RepID=A0AAN9EKN0_CROPI